MLTSKLPVWEQVGWTDVLNKNNILIPSKLFESSTASNLNEHISKPHQIAQTLLGKPAALLKVQQLNEQISERFFFLPPACIKWAIICMHEGWKEKHTEGKYNPRSPFTDMGQLYFRHQWDFLISGHVQGRACGEGKLGGRWLGFKRVPSAALLPVSQPDTVFNSQPRTGVELITSRHTQFKADFGGKI